MKRIFFNKYFYVSLGFILWMLFVDQESILVQFHLSKDINGLKQQEKFYLKEIQKNKAALNIIINDTTSLEKYARETYFMKKPNEDIFVVVEE